MFLLIVSRYCGEPDSWLLSLRLSLEFKTTLTQRCFSRPSKFAS